MQIHYRPSPNFSSRRGTKIDAIVVHATGAGTVESTINWFSKRYSYVSSHYTISKKGVIYRHVADTNKAWHAGVSNLFGRKNVNDFSVGIELANLNNGTDPYPAEQIESLAWLVNDLATKHKIPAQRVVSHASIAPGRKTDPKNFPWDTFWGIMRSKYWPKPKRTIAKLPTLRRGSKGDAVKKLQKLLGGLKVDGLYGWRTYWAVRNFQRSRRLKVDGIVGAKTWGALLG